MLQQNANIYQFILRGVVKKMNNPKKSSFKNAGQKTFMKIGNMAIGNSNHDDNIPVEPFSFGPWFPYEKPMPKRKSK